MRGFKAQQLARKLGCLGNEMVVLVALEIGNRIRMGLWNEIEKCSTADDKEQIKLRIRRWMETAIEGMIKKYSTADDKEQVNLRVVRWMGEALLCKRPWCEVTLNLYPFCSMALPSLVWGKSLTFALFYVDVTLGPV